MIVDELVTLLGFETAPGSEQNARKFGASIDKIKTFAVTAGVALAGATAAVGAWAVSLAKSVDEAGKFADSIGVGYEELQEFEFAVERSGGSADALRADMQKLTQSMSSPIPGEFNKELMLLGVSTRSASGGLRSATDVLTDLSSKFEGMSAQKANQFGAKLGLSQDTIMLLQQGSDGIAQLRKEARDLGGILPEDSKKKAAEFNDALTNINFSLTGIARQAGMAVLPALTEVVQAANQFIAANRDIIQSGLETFVNGAIKGFQQFGTLVSDISSYFMDLMGPISGFTENLDMVDVVATGVTSALAGVAVVVGLLLVKFVAIGAIIAAVVVAMQDLIVYFQGGDSVIGRMLDTLGNRFPAVFNGVRDFIVQLGSIISEWAEGVSSRVSAVIGFFEDFAKKFPKLTSVILATLDVIGAAFGATFGAIGDIVNFVLDVVTDLAGIFADLAGSGIMSVLQGLEGLLGGGEQPSQVSQPIPASISNSAVSQSSNSNTTIMVQGSGDPLTVANEVVRRGNLQNVTQQIAPGLNAGVIE